MNHQAVNAVNKKTQTSARIWNGMEHCGAVAGAASAVRCSTSAKTTQETRRTLKRSLDRQVESPVATAFWLVEDDSKSSEISMDFLVQHLWSRRSTATLRTNRERTLPAMLRGKSRRLLVRSLPYPTMNF